ncbi:MAG: hypothetical protein ABI977_03730 [Acidobacteriota bacterium]
MRKWLLIVLLISLTALFFSAVNLWHVTGGISQAQVPAIAVELTPALRSRAWRLA